MRGNSRFGRRSICVLRTTVGLRYGGDRLLPFPSAVIPELDTVGDIC